MDRLEDMDSNILSLSLVDLIPKLEGHKIKNKLLDGSLHIQIVGNPLKTINFKIVVNNTDMNIINLMDFNGEDMKVFYDNNFYIGKIDALIDWKEELFGEVDTRLYSANIKMITSGEGTI